MALSAGLILLTVQGQHFAIDEIFYYGRVVDDDGALVQYEPLALEYLLAPFNSHLALGGRLVYELVFATVGPRYHVLVLVNIAAVLTCVGLTFELVRRRVGTPAALSPCIVLVLLGFASEQLLWPLDFNSAVSLAAGLGAVMAVERDTRRGDLAACLLLVASVAMIELGLSFALGIAVWLLLERAGGLRRIWVAAVPILLYAAWWVWAQRFGQSVASASNLDLIPETLFKSAAAVVGSLTGTNEVQSGSFWTEITWVSRGLAVVAAAALAVRLRRGSLPRTTWIWLTVLVSYWVQLALAERPPQVSRYIFVGAVLVVLVGADALRNRVSTLVAPTLAVVAVLALPPNIAQLVGGRDEDNLHNDAPIRRTQFAMIELARDEVDPAYMVTYDPRVVEARGSLFNGIPAGMYLEAASENGSLAFPLDEVRAQDPDVRHIADASLIGALGITARAGPTAPSGSRCRIHLPQGGDSEVEFEVPVGVAMLRSRAGNPVPLGLRRFGDPGSRVVVGDLRPRWAELDVPPDAAPDAWHAIVEAPVEVCLPARRA
jgi:hypothetical protein